MEHALLTASKQSFPTSTVYYIIMRTIGFTLLSEVLGNRTLKISMLNMYTTQEIGNAVLYFECVAASTVLHNGDPQIQF